MHNYAIKVIDSRGQLFLDSATSYREQVLAMTEGGADFVWIMTMTDVNLTVTAIKAVKENSGMPVFASMAFDSTPKGPKTMMGVGPAEAAEKLDRSGADVIGLNCGGLAIEEVSYVLKEMAAITRKPLVSKPNAGVPHIKKGETIHPISAKLIFDTTKNYSIYYQRITTHKNCLGTTTGCFRHQATSRIVGGSATFTAWKILPQ